MNRRYCLALDLQNDAGKIKEYEGYHSKEKMWPEIIKSIRESGIINMEIFRTGNRLFMIMEVEEHFTFEKKIDMDASNARVQEWEKLMWQFQQPLPHAEKNQKWVLMDSIFSLSEI